MKKLIIYLLPSLIIIGCSKKTELSPDIPLVQKPTENISEIVQDSIAQGIEEIPIVDITSNTDATKDVLVESEEYETEPADSNFPVELEPEPEVIPEPQTSIAKEFDYDKLLPDSIWTDYMTKRGDYLSLIAYKEYSNANEWRRIYEWNKKHWEERGIGPDRDNPNFIYPYRELDLKKPAEDAIEWAYDHYVHVVTDGESLWSIAKKEYGDELAWVILFWDNEKLIDSNDGKLLPGMQLKVRSELWPELD